MKLSLLSLGTMGVVLALYACADSETATTSTDAVDGSTLPPNEDSGSLPPVDAGPEADVVVPPKVCSDQGFCTVPLPAPENLTGVWGDGAGVVWSISEEGSVLRWDGTAWKVHASGLGPLRAIWGSGPADIWIGGENGILHSTGAAFTASDVPDAGGAIAIASLWGSAPDDVWAVGTEDGRSTVLRWDGAKWTHAAVPPDFTYTRVWGHAASGVWLAGLRPLPPPDDYLTEAVVLHRGPGLTGFTEETLPRNEEYDGPFFSTMGEVRGAAAPTGALTWIFSRSLSSTPSVFRGTSADNGSTFAWTYTQEKQLAARPINSVFAVSASDAWAVGDYGVVVRWDGAEWKPQGITPTMLPITKAFNGVWATADRAYLVGKEVALEWRKP